jgi:type IV pilus assembly protein PilP
VRPYDSFLYDGTGLRSPFTPYVGANTSSVKPTSNRNKEFLEQFPMDQLAMAGTVTYGGKTYGVIKTKDNSTVQRVLPGNYMGLNEGRVTRIEPAKISFVEIVPDPLGGYMERSATLTLTE